MISLSNKINSAIQNFDIEAQRSLENLLVRKQVKKGEYLLAEGFVCRNCIIIEEGIARKFLISKNKEITMELYFKDDIAVSFDSLCNQSASNEWIQTLSDVTITLLNFQDFQKLKSTYPELIKLDLIIAEHYTIWLEKKLISFRCFNASERYLHLLENNPHYVQKIPLFIIASYLGVAIETLSRIRAKI